ncbi:MAG TPA: NAD(P)-dependent oxidoreductase [Runella sp.]|nr:NAD(P)-dependent oxidoreductase [Runella sp.]
MKILVIGASGLVGGNCLVFFKEKGWEVVGTHLSFSENQTIYLDTSDIDSALNEAYFNLSFIPNVIVHCAALTNVDYCEQHEEESYKKTVASAKNVLVLAKNYGAKLVYISTDYVFDGKNGPYIESDIPSPLGIYGKHKLEAEELVKNELEDYLVLRVTNVYGDEARGKNFISRIINNTLSNKVLELPVDQFATPINAKDIAKVIYLLVMDNKKGIYHLGSTDYFNRYHLAYKIKKSVNTTELTLIPKYTNELKQPAQRPLKGGLLSFKFLTEYPDFIFSNVDDYLSDKIQQVK